MPTYAFKARDARGASRADMIEAPNEHSAIQMLRSEGLTVTDIRLAKSVIDVEEVRRRQAARAVNREEVIAFTSQMSVMLETGVPISEALGAYLSQSKGGNLAKIVEVVADRINSGVAFSAAIGEFPRVFPNMMVSLVKASEATGALGGMLGRVSNYLSKDRKTIKTIQGALAYPIVMISMALIVTGFLVTWVLPRFAKIYESRSATLPTPTRMLLDTSNFIIGNIAMIVTGLIAVIVAALFFRASKRGREYLDWFKVRAPIIGPIFRNFYMARASRTLGTLIGAGVSIPQAVKITRGVTNNVIWARLWDEMERSMAAGRTIGEVVLASDLLTPAYAQMVAAGERTGRLADVLDKVATVTEEDLDEQIKASTQMIEPIVITFMGATIGGIAIALLLPIFAMGSVMK